MTENTTYTPGSGSASADTWHPSPEQLQAWADNTAERGLSELVEQHLAGCADCRDMLELVVAFTIGGLDEEMTQITPTGSSTAPKGEAHFIEGTLVTVHPIEGELWLAECLTLGQAGEGNTAEAAMEALSEVVAEYCESLLSHAEGGGTFAGPAAEHVHFLKSRGEINAWCSAFAGALAKSKMAWRRELPSAILPEPIRGIGAVLQLSIEGIKGVISFPETATLKPVYADVRKKETGGTYSVVIVESWKPYELCCQITATDSDRFWIQLSLKAQEEHISVKEIPVRLVQQKTCEQQEGTHEKEVWASGHWHISAALVSQISMGLVRQEIFKQRGKTNEQGVWTSESCLANGKYRLLIGDRNQEMSLELSFR